MNKVEIQQYLNKVNSYIDYKVGDWVETCNMLPGIVQEINNYYDSRKLMQCFVDDVVIFYPHETINNDNYQGGTCCSILNCGVHKISQEYAKILFAIGREMLEKLWSTTYLESDNTKQWSDIVIEHYNNNIEKYKNNGVELFNIGEEYSRKIKK